MCYGFSEEEDYLWDNAQSSDCIKVQAGCGSTTKREQEEMKEDLSQKKLSVALSTPSEEYEVTWSHIKETGSDGMDQWNS